MMGVINYFELFGQPISHPGVQQLIAQYHLIDEFKDLQANVERDLARQIPGYASKRVHYEHHDSRYSSIVDDKYTEMVIGLSAAKWTHAELGPEHVKLVNLIQFWHNFTGEFPLNFDPKTSYQEVNLGALISKEKGYGNCIANFLVDDFEVAVCYSEVGSFGGLTIRKISPATLLKMHFDASLKTQKANINKNFSDKKPALLLKSPVASWRARKHDGDDLLTEAGLESATQIIHNYLHAVDSAAQKSSAIQIVAAVKQVVKAFNKLNKNKTSFNMIETSEREDLVPFIVEVAKTAGLQIPEGFDVTLECRDW